MRRLRALLRAARSLRKRMRKGETVIATIETGVKAKDLLPPRMGKKLLLTKLALKLQLLPRIRRRKKSH